MNTSPPSDIHTFIACHCTLPEKERWLIAPIRMITMIRHLWLKIATYH